MHRFAQCAIIWKIFQNLVIHIFRNHNDAIVELSSIQTSWIISTVGCNYCASYFMCSWIKINFIDNYRHIICNSDLSNHLPFIHICVYSLWRINDTGIIMTSQRRCHARDSQNHAYIFNNARFVAARFGNSLADCGFVMYQNELIHVIIGFVRSKARRGHEDKSVNEVRSAECTDVSEWPLSASDLTMHATLCFNPLLIPHTYIC